MCRPTNSNTSTTTTSSASSGSTARRTARTTRTNNTNNNDTSGSRTPSPPPISPSSSSSSSRPASPAASVSSSSSSNSQISTPGSSYLTRKLKSISDVSLLSINPLSSPGVAQQQKTRRLTRSVYGGRKQQQEPSQQPQRESFSLSSLWTSSSSSSFGSSNKKDLMHYLRYCIMFTLLVSWTMYYCLSSSDNDDNYSMKLLRGNNNGPSSKYNLDITAVAAQAAAVAAEQRSAILRNKMTENGFLDNINDSEEDVVSSHVAVKDVGKSTIVEHNVTLSDIINITVLSEKRMRIDSSDYVKNIPAQFVETDRDLYSFDRSIRAPFPRWDFTTDLQKDGMSNDDLRASYSTSIIDSILDFVSQQGEYFNTFSPPVDPDERHEYLFSFGKKNKVHTSDHLKSYTPGNWYPEALYIIDGRHRQIVAPHGKAMTEKFTVYSSDFTKELSDVDSEATTYKINPTEKLMKMALHLLNHHSVSSLLHRWPRLYQVLMVEHSSFPFLAHYSDFIGCNYHNWNHHTESIPLFTVAANVKCNHTFPFPTYQTLLNSRNAPATWLNEITQKAQRYPVWRDRISKVVWRGSLTGQIPKDVEKRAPRWHLTKLVHDELRLTKEQRDLFDVKLTQIPDMVYQHYINEEELGGVDHEKNAMTIDDFNQYKAVLDVDGHSWSNRYSDLFCGKSVILKVEPDYVDYFYYPINTTEESPHLTAWKEYIPVKKDLSDLVEKSAWAVDIKNEEQIQKIVKNANDWCMNGFNTIKAATDVLDIWEEYIRVLDQSSLLQKVVLETSNTKTDVAKQLWDVMQKKDGSASDKEVTGSGNIKTITRTLHRSDSWQTKWLKVRDDVFTGPLQMSPVKKAKNYWK